MPLPFQFDWKHPDYRMVCEWRIERLEQIRADPDKWIPRLSTVYAADPAQFIIDWGITTDPRNPEIGLPTTLPFLLFPHQEELVNEIMYAWKHRQNLLVEKTREMGASWVTVALACTLCNFRDGLTIGFGSRTKEYVDEKDNPKSLFWKARQFMIGLPVEFVGGWLPKDASGHRRKPRPWNPFTDAPQMRITFPHRNSFMTGEAGSGIGRGDRTSLYIIDEAAFLEHPEENEFSLSRTTNCRIEISTPNGMGNPFAQKRFGGKVKVFTYHWSQDPRKDKTWYEAEKLKLDNALVVARELDINYASSIEGVLIPTEWFQASIDAHVKLGVEITGQRIGGFDVADEGIDKNAFAGRVGILLDTLEEWSGVGLDIYRSVERVFGICDKTDCRRFFSDADGLGAGVRGDVRVINQERRVKGIEQIQQQEFHGSGKVWRPDDEVKLGSEGLKKSKRTNKDYFYNLKAQSWWQLRLKFQATYRAVVEKLPFNAEDLISIDSRIPDLIQLQMEMQQPTWSMNGTGHILIDKMPKGMRSPNKADAVMICYNPVIMAGSSWAKLGEAWGVGQR